MMTDLIKQTEEEIEKLKKDAQKLRRLEITDSENGTYDSDYYNAEWKYILGKLDGLEIALTSIKVNDNLKNWNN